MSKEYTVKSQTYMSTIRTDGNGTRIIDTNSEVEMRKQLRHIAAMDNDARKVLVNINGTTMEFIRDIRRSDADGKMNIGPLKEITNGQSPFIDPTADVSSQSVIMANAHIKAGSVVMGNIIYENVTIDNHALYNGESYWW